LFRSLVCGLTASLFGLLLVNGTPSVGQSAAPPASTSKTPKVSLADVVRNLPEYSKPGTQLTYSEAFENATPEERDAAVPTVMSWIRDDRPEVRGHALLSLSFLYMPSVTSRVITCSRYLPVEDVPIVATHLRDPDSRVRNATFLALGSVKTCGHGLDVLIDLVLPMLREADILTEYPDPFFIESDQRMLATMPPQQQAAFKAQHRPVIKLPAEGPVLLSILATPTRTPSVAVDDAIVAFLDRPDQTKSTLGECLHTLALSNASERVNDEALGRVFELKAMTVYLLQFVSRMRLTPTQLAVEKERLIDVSNDESRHPELRKAAATVAACWVGQRNSRPCQPLTEEMTEENQRPAEQR
jgi:hypothetical protein